MFRMPVTALLLGAGLATISSALTLACPALSGSNRDLLDDQRYRVGAEYQALVDGLNDPFLSKLNTVYLKNEAYDGWAAYRLIDSQYSEKSGLSYGPAQFDLATGEGYPQVFEAIVRKAVTAKLPGGPTQADLDLLSRTGHCASDKGKKLYACPLKPLRDLKPQMWQALCEVVPRLNLTLSQADAKKEIAQHSLELLKARRTKLAAYVDRLPPEGRAFVNGNEVVGLQLLDYANLYGDPNSILRQLRKENGCIYDDKSKARLHACKPTDDIANPNAPEFSDLLRPLIRTLNWTVHPADVVRRLETVLAASVCGDVPLKPGDQAIIKGEFAAAAAGWIAKAKAPCLSKLLKNAQAS